MKNIEYRAWQKVVNVIRITKYGIFVGVLLLWLPLTAFRPVWPHLYLGNMFHDLGGLEVFFLTVAMLGAAWSLVFTQGLMVQGLAIRYRAEQLNKNDRESIVGDLIHEKLRNLFTIPLTRGQLYLVALFSSVGLFVINWFALEGPLSSLTMTALGIFASLIVAVVPALLVRLAYPDYAPLKFLSEGHRDTFWSWVRRIGRWPGIQWLKMLVRWFVKQGKTSFHWLAEHSPMKYMAEPEYEAHHFLAALAALTLAGILAFVGWFFAPGWQREASPAFYLYILLVLIIWVFSSLDFHLSRRRVSPLLVVVVLVLLVDLIIPRDHYFEIARLDSPRSAPVARTQDGENLVVVTATGGGITAAGWTTWALKELIAQRPDVRYELGLVSAVSGGSVGTAFFVDGLAECDWQTEQDAPSLHPSNATCLETIYERSVAPSIGSITYGFAYADFWRLVTFGLFPFRDVDRGVYLEDNWRRLATAQLRTGEDGNVALWSTTDSRRRAVSELAERVESGEVPAFIFATAAMESGRRVMITPVAFDSPCLYGFPKADVGWFPNEANGSEHGKERGCTLDEYLDPSEAIDLDRGRRRASRRRSHG